MKHLIYSGASGAMLSLVLSLALPLSGLAADFTRNAQFDSIHSFVSEAKAFRLAKTRTDLADLFTVPEIGPDEPHPGKPIVPERLDKCTVLWEGAAQALVFAAATPKTYGTHSAVGVLFLLSRLDNRWTIADSLRFTASGKYADVVAELTAGVATGSRLGADGMQPIITICEVHGGRGYGFQLSASFSFEANKLKRLELE